MKEDEQLPKEDEAQLEFHCEQCNYETMSNADLSHHVKLKHKSFNNFLKSKGLPILFYFHNRNPKNMRKKTSEQYKFRNTGEESIKKASMTNRCNMWEKCIPANETLQDT